MIYRHVIVWIGSMVPTAKGGHEVFRQASMTSKILLGAVMNVMIFSSTCLNCSSN
jgi:hypothetical protein